MALIKEKLEYGIPVNYWKIIEVNINRKHKRGVIGVDLFASKSAEKSVDVFSFPVKSENFTEFFEDKSGRFSDIYNCAYEYIKATYPEMGMIDDEEEVVKKSND